MLKVALLQITSTSDIDNNLAKIRKYCAQAKKEGAHLFLSPENVYCLPSDKENVVEEDKHPALAFFKDLCIQHSLWILIGSLSIRAENNKIYNRSYLLNEQGKIVAHYDKIHLFDAAPSKTEIYQESTFYSAGAEACVVKTDLGNFGLSICYDLRFPNLYRDLARHGAEYIFVPSAFTMTTGKVHWLPLLQARAIENGCFIIAPAQCGNHCQDRESYGHSMVISPWGEIRASLENEEGLLVVSLDPNEIQDARQRIRSLHNSTQYHIKVVDELSKTKSVK